MFVRRSTRGSFRKGTNGGWAFGLLLVLCTGTCVLIAEGSAPPIGEVDGCFNATSSKVTKTMHELLMSNLRCHTYCAEEGYVVAATQKNECHCANVYPQNAKVNDTLCDIPCGETEPGSCSGRGCCGGEGYYSVGVVGDLNVPKQVLRRVSESLVTGRGSAFRAVIIEGKLGELTALKDVDGKFVTCSHAPIAFTAKGDYGDERFSDLEVTTYGGKTFNVGVKCSETGTGQLTKNYQECTPDVSSPAGWASLKDAKTITLKNANHKPTSRGSDRNVQVLNGEFWFYGKNIFRSATDDTSEKVMKNEGGRLNMLRAGYLNWEKADMFVPPSNTLWLEARGRSGKEVLAVAAELNNDDVVEFSIKCESTGSGAMTKEYQICTADDALPGGVANVRRLWFKMNDNKSNDVYVKDGRLFLEGVNVMQNANFEGGKDDGRIWSLSAGNVKWSRTLATLTHSDYDWVSGTLLSSKEEEEWQVVLQTVTTPNYGEDVLVTLKNTFTGAYLWNDNGLARCDALSPQSASSKFKLHFDDDELAFRLETNTGSYVGKNAGTDFSATFTDASSTATLFKPNNLRLKALLPWLRVSIVMDGELHTMAAYDESANSVSYTRGPLPSDYQGSAVGAELDQVAFESSDETAIPLLRVPLPDGRLVCETDPDTTLDCIFDYKKVVSEEASLVISSGSSLSIGKSVDSTIGVKVGKSFSTSVSASAFGAEAKVGTEINWSASIETSFNRASEIARSTHESHASTTVSSTSRTYRFETEVPPNATRTIQVFLSKVDVEYRWRATFLALGGVDFSFGLGEFFDEDLDLARFLMPGTGEDEFFALGIWSYPDQAVLIGTASDSLGNGIDEEDETQAFLLA